MAIELIPPKSTYTINGTPTGTIEVSSSSDKYLTVPQALDFAEKQGGRLQTIAKALVARIAFYEANKKNKSGLNDSDKYQITSTISLKVKNKGFDVDAPYVTLFVDLPVDERSRALAQEGFDANNNGKELIKPVTDSFICELITQAKETGRVAPALTSNPLELKIAQVKGKSEYGQHQTPIAIFGSSELAELNANYLADRGYKFGKVWDFTAKKLEEVLGKEDDALIRAVGLGGGDYVSIDDVRAGGSFNYGDGRARSVVHVGAQNFPV